MSDEPTGPDQMAPSDDERATGVGTGAQEPTDRVIRLSTDDQDLTSGKGSLVSPLMSGRSLEPLDSIARPSWVRTHVRILVVVFLIVAAVIGVGLAKIVAEGAANSSTDTRVAELRLILGDATPRDFLAFDAGVKVPDSVARRIRDQDGFVNLQAGADTTTIRIQPKGWWAGFTERCIVMTVRDEQTLIDVVKRSCVRVDVTGS